MVSPGEDLELIRSSNREVGCEEQGGLEWPGRRCEATSKLDVAGRTQGDGDEICGFSDGSALCLLGFYP